MRGFRYSHPHNGAYFGYNIARWSALLSPLSTGRVACDVLATAETPGSVLKLHLLGPSLSFFRQCSAILDAYLSIVFNIKLISLSGSVALVMTTATTVTAFVSNAATTTATPVDVVKDKDVPTPSIFAGSSSSDKTDRTLSLFTGKSGSDFVAGSIRAGGDADVDLQEIYIPEWRRIVYGVAQRPNRVSSLEAIEGSLRGEVASSKEHNGLLEQERSALKLKVTGLESIIAEKDHELSDLGTSSASLRLTEIDADFTRCCMHFQENFHPRLLNAIARRRWLLTHGMKLLMAKCLNSTEYMEALGNAFGRAIEKGMQEGLAAGIEHGQAGRCLSDLEAYNPSAEADFNSAVRDLRGLDFPLLRELSAKKDASTWDVMDLLRLDDAVAEVLGMTDLQPDVGQLMVPVHHKQDKVVIGSQALSVALETCHSRVRKMERNLTERLPFLKDVFVSIDHPVSAEALAILPETL
ncbi:hypothetical protein Tco_1391498 [Tanacetum coccineum]